MTVIIAKKHPITLLLEHLAADTWHRLRYAKELDISQGEETITDNHLLEIAKSHHANIRLWKCPKRDESRYGIDWEWFIGSPSQGWYRYAIQAKKLSRQAERYDNLGYVVKHGKSHTTHPRRQIDILDDYSKINNAIPLYCFYNYVQKATWSDYWRCCARPEESEQLGCTVTPLSNIRRALTITGGQSFHYIHKEQCTIPWRCLTMCPFIMDSPVVHPLDEREPLRACYRGVGYHREIPPNIDSLLARGPEERISQDLWAQSDILDPPVIPKRILIIEV